jgi:hypothetical protein
MAVSSRLIGHSGSPGTWFCGKAGASRAGEGKGSANAELRRKSSSWRTTKTGAPDADKWRIDRSFAFSSAPEKVFFAGFGAAIRPERV